MKQQYESEILFHLMERDGFNIPSSVPPYEAEIKSYLINQVKQAYPKLRDYEAEWLLYNYTNHLPADFPISSVSNVTEASFENVVPFAYQSAILKGRTLVNLTKNFKYQMGWTDVWGGESINTKRCCYQVENVKGKTKYFIKNFGESTQAFIRYYGNSHANILSHTDWIDLPTIITTPTNTVKFSVTIRISDNNEDYTSPEQVNKNIVVEYRDGMENWDISYFEGMQSVKMPVLTTSNEDGTKSNILSTSEDVVLRGIGDVRDTLDCLTGELTQRIGEVLFDGITNNNVPLRYSSEWSTETVSTFQFTLSNSVSLTPTRIITNCKMVELENEDLGMVIGRGSKGSIFIKVAKSIATIDDFNSYLKTNNISFAYLLETPVVKTVELKTVNETGESVYFMPLEGTMHVQSSGEFIQPTFDMSVPVEATTQNLASFIDLEMGE